MNKYGNIIQSGLRCSALSKKFVLKYQRIYKLTRPRSEWPSMVGQRANSVQKPVLFAGLALFFILICRFSITFLTLCICKYSDQVPINLKVRFVKIKL